MTITISGPKAGFLSVKGHHICQDGQPILLRGVCLGGWMSMEGFITGYAGHEHQMRAGMKQVLGREKYEYYFDKFLEYFFQEEDAVFLAENGFNLVRIAINYRHFEDDDNPRVFKPEGLKHLDRVIDLLAQQGIYTIIDLHCLPGGQNGDWHSDNPTDQPLLWVHKDFQDRTVLLWQHLAKHYRENAWIAGYNPLNEPAEKSNVILNAFMKRLSKAIRTVDPNHILFWDGNGFGSDFRAFDEPLPNSVFACHDYSIMGSRIEETYTGSLADRKKVAQSIEWKTEYQREYKVPVWREWMMDVSQTLRMRLPTPLANARPFPASYRLLDPIILELSHPHSQQPPDPKDGEFGIAYLDPEDHSDAEKINAQRIRLLGEQVRLYDTYPNISWTVWCYKDIGTSGLCVLSKDSPYMRLLKPWFERKKAACLDSWGVDTRSLDYLFRPMWDWLCDIAPTMRERYPKVLAGSRGRHLSRLVRQCLLADEMVPEFCTYFEGKSFEELDQLAQSFAFKHCIQRGDIIDVLRHPRLNVPSSISET